KSDHEHGASGLKLPNSYHRISRLNLDQQMRAATITVAVYPGEQQRRDGKQPISSADYVCQNRLVAPPTPPEPGDTVPPGEANDYEDWFGSVALKQSDPFAQAYGYLKQNVPAYKDAQDA